MQNQKKTVIPAQAGIQAIFKPHEVGQGQLYGVVRYAEPYDNWIPACAGMTAAIYAFAMNKDR